MVNIGPCPFCKCTNVLATVHQGLYFVFCNGCRAKGPKSETEELAVELWNNGSQDEEKSLLESRVKKIDELKEQITRRYEMPPLGCRMYGRAFFYAEIKALLEI